ncbi:hypothetical protein LTR27_008390 [Elasticomyces elasticus]|nr:hypothetical protein LTR27_008390 [Elasticomyces elasticus]
MVKRARDISDEDEESPKRIKQTDVDRLSRLSDELTLRVLSFLPTSQLVVCERLAHKYRVLAGDGQLWKQRFYERFVQSRASKYPGLKDDETPEDISRSTARSSRWLKDEHLLKQGAKMNWKRQYKLRHNWTQGSAVVSEIPVAEESTIPPVLVQMHEGVIYMADTDGLRAWSTKGERKMVAKINFEAASAQWPPTALAIGTGSSDGISRISVGFENGAFSVFNLDQAQAQFSRQYSHAASSNGVISATAVSWPYVVTMTATQLLSLYRFDRRNESQEVHDPPRLLHSLKSNTIWPPLSTSLRTSETSTTITVAYALPTYLSGWTVGLQEVKVSLTGDLIESRLASAVGQHYRPLAFSVPPLMQHLSLPNTTTQISSTTVELRHIHSKPTSLSYTHPYLLVSHPDNTLTLYLVTSTTESLSISAGSRLWGHTSSVSGAHVGDRGKAVSVSTRGDELRLWELEGGFASSAAKKRLAAVDLSVRVRPELRRDATDSKVAELNLVTQALSARGTNSCAVEQRLEDESELTLTRGWVGFDEENVVVLKEQGQGRQALVVYDFT